MQGRRDPVRAAGRPMETAFGSLLAMSLELERRPTLLINAARRVLAANSAMTSLLKRTLDSLSGSDIEAILASDSLVTFRNALEKTSPGTDRCVEGNLVADHGPLVPFTARLAAAAVSNSEPPAFFLTILEVRTDVETAVLANGIAYLVSSENGTFGNLKMVWGVVAGRSRAEMIGRRCFEVFYGREGACIGCPVFTRMVGGRTITGVLPGNWDDVCQVEVVSARATCGSAIAVTRWPVGQELVSSLVACKIDMIIGKARLSGQEAEVLRLLLLGRSIAEIAQEMGIVARTAKYHQKKILRKIGAESRLDLTRLLL